MMRKRLERLFSGVTSGHDSRSAADAARDAKDWTLAVQHYRAFLASYPRNGPIWVQLGNCAKEAGDYALASMAYDKAIALDANNDDARLQRGHLFTIQGRKSEALSEYHSSLALKPESNRALTELISRGAADGIVSSVRKTAARRLFIDVTDIIQYLAVNMSLSGIQRVVANLLLCAEAYENQHPDLAIEAIYPDYGELRVFTVDINVCRLMFLALADGCGQGTIISMVEAIKNSRRAVDVGASDTVLLPGAFWIFHKYDLLANLRNRGAQVVPFIHDLIQITNPEFVERAAHTKFCLSFCDLVSVSTYILTNSEYVARDVRAFISEKTNVNVPTYAIKLATETVLETTSSRVSDYIAELENEDFVLCVGTIEVRKNHLYLIEIWERLIAERADWIPNLVFVGKWGWEIEKLREHLAQSDYLGARLLIYNGISDADLAFLYKHCTFTIYPSFAEGWGLPVGESLANGKPCIASKATSIPEVGGDWCRYIDPFDVEQGYAVVAETLRDRKGLEAWASRIAEGFNPKTWEDFSLELFDKTTEMVSVGRSPETNCVIEPGEIAYFGDNALLSMYQVDRKLNVARMTRTSGWHGLDAAGCWTRRRRAELRFRSELAGGTQILLFLCLRSPDGDLAAECVIACGPHSTHVVGLQPNPAWQTARGVVSEDGTVRVSLVSGRGFRLHDREAYVGIVAIALSAADDASARQRIVEQIVPGGLAPALSS